MKRGIRGVLIACLMTLIALPAISQGVDAVKRTSISKGFPKKNLTLIIPYGAGGGTDAVGRALAHAAEKIFGKTIIVQNITGGTGIVGISTMLQSKPDGYTMSTISGELISLPVLGLAPENFDYTKAKPVMQVNADPNCFVVKKDSPFNNLDDLIKGAKANPGSIVMATTGSGGTHHLTALMFESETGTDLKVIPYQEGANAAVVALLGGHVDVACVGPAEAASYLAAGDAKMLGIASTTRLAAYPNTPTFIEQKVNIVYGTWRGLAVPFDTPDEIVAVLTDAFLKASEDPEFVKFMGNNGFGIERLDTESFKKKIADQVPSITKVAQVYKSTQKK